MDALIFDCDGVLVDTERDGHRVAFNAAFEDAGLAITWSVERYGELLTTGGGKERMVRHFNESGWPIGFDDRDALI
ncbi:MAG: HAD family hydrolase, partial [Alphaproteobacteria bacterium]|nr:HAD family hydrolase [Alphaproteobacteria bacterium]